MRKTKKIKSPQIRPPRLMGDKDLLNYVEYLKYEIKYLKRQVKRKEELAKGITLLLLDEGDK